MHRCGAGCLVLPCPYEASPWRWLYGNRRMSQTACCDRVGQFADANVLRSINPSDHSSSLSMLEYHL